MSISVLVREVGKRVKLIAGKAAAQHGGTHR
jgi:hypothetical protein